MLKYKLRFGDLTGGTISMPISTDFSPNTKQYERIEENFDITGEDIVNTIIDYEKIKLHPVTGETGILDINSINFKLHFYTGGTQGWSVDTSRLLDVGFIEDDIINKRNRLKKTFIRVSFYDSNDLKTQNLLFYSTIFLDVDKIYGNYINYGIDYSGLTTEFLVKNPKTSSELKSFEGYYLYLFKDDVQKNNITSIYMKCEYNNAINGKSLLFFNSKPSNANGTTLKAVPNYMFTKVNVDYNQTTDKYIYWFDNLTNKNIEINLYQGKAI